MRIGKAATTLGRLISHVWENPKLTTPTKMAVYKACIVSTLLYSSETWTTYSKQESKLNSFHMRCLRRILSIQWSDKVPNAQVLERAGLPTMFTRTQTTLAAMAWPHPDGGWPYTRGHPLRRTCLWQENYWPPPTAL